MLAFVRLFQSFSTSTLTCVSSQEHLDFQLLGLGVTSGPTLHPISCCLMLYKDSCLSGVHVLPHDPKDILYNDPNFFKALSYTTFIHSFNKYLLNAYWVGGNVPGLGGNK